MITAPSEKAYEFLCKELGTPKADLLLTMLWIRGYKIVPVDYDGVKKT